MKLILASASPRRREILTRLGVEFTVHPADVDESSTLTDAAALVEELSRRKATAVQEEWIAAGKSVDDLLILGCDTVVCLDGEILGKPRDRADAKRMLCALSGRTHNVISGVTLLYGDRVLTSHDTTRVMMEPMTDREIESYVATGEPDDKAGAYAIQGLAARWVRGIEGNYDNVVGLPSALLFRMAKELGVEI